MFEAFGMMDDMESMHLLFQFFLVFSLLLQFFLFFANCRLPMKSDVAEWLVPNLCEDNWTDVGYKDRNETTKFKRRDAGMDDCDPRLTHRWPIWTHKKRRQLGMMLQQNVTICSSRPLKSTAAGRREFEGKVTLFVYFFCRRFLIQRKRIARVLVDKSLVSHSQFENFGSDRSFVDLFLDCGYWTISTW